MNFGLLTIIFVALSEVVFSALTVSNEEKVDEANVVKAKNYFAAIDDAVIISIGFFFNCPQSHFGSVNKRFKQLFMNDFPLEKYMSLRFDLPELFKKNLRSRYIFLASNLNLPLDESLPENVAGLLKMLKDRGQDGKIALEFVTELYNKAELSFNDRADEFRQWLNAPCRTNADHQTQGQLFAHFIFAGDRYKHDKNLLARIMHTTGDESLDYFMLLFETGTSLPFFNKVVNELAVIDIHACMEIAQVYPDIMQYSFWAAISKNDYNGRILPRIFEINLNSTHYLGYRNSCIFEADETLLNNSQKIQVWNRNNRIMNSYIINRDEHSQDQDGANYEENFQEMFRFLNNWKYRPELITEEQIVSCIDLPSDKYLLLQLARTIIRKQRFELLLQCLERANGLDSIWVYDFELQDLISSSYEASAIVNSAGSNYNFFLNLKTAEMPLETVLSQNNSSNLNELIVCSSAEKKIEYAIKFSNDPEILKSILEGLTSFNVILSVIDVFKYHSESEKLYDWVRVLVDKSKNMIFDIIQYEICIDDINTSSLFKILSDENVSNSLLFSSVEFYLMNGKTLLKHACRLESFTEILIRNPKLHKSLRSSSEYDLLICEDANEITRLMKIYLAIVPNSTESDFFKDFIDELNSSGVDRLPSVKLGLEFWKVNFPEDFGKLCPAKWKKIIDSLGNN